MEMICFASRLVKGSGFPGKTRRALFGIILALSVVVSPLAVVEAQPLKKVYLGIPSSVVLMGSFFVAKEQGYYKQEGLDVDFVVITGAGVVQALIGGDLHFAISAGAALVPILRGIPLRFIFTSFNRPIFWIYSRPEIQSVEGLKGKRLGISSFGSGPDVLLHSFFKKYGLDRGRDVTMMAIGSTPSRVTALKTGVVEAAVLPIEGAFVARDAGFRELASFIKEDDLVDVLGSIVTNQKLLETDPNLVERFIRASLKGFLYYRGNRPGSIRILAKILKTNTDEAARIYDTVIPATTKDGTVDAALQRKALEYVLDRLGMKEPPPLDRIYNYSMTKNVFADLQAKGWVPQ